MSKGIKKLFIHSVCRAQLIDYGSLHMSVFHSDPVLHLALRSLQQFVVHLNSKPSGTDMHKSVGILTRQTETVKLMQQKI